MARTGSWRSLRIAEGIREEDLQHLFDSWPELSGFADMAGLPEWLGALRVKRTRPTGKAFGYSFIPDAVFDTEERRFVVELKYADKFEPLALAEVLHHARFHEAFEKGASVVPVIISRYNAWLRLSITHLREHGFHGELLYYEVDALVADGSGKRLLWFDAPLAPWKPVIEGQGPLPPAGLTAEYPERVWHYVQATKTWYGLEEQCPKRPEVLEGPAVVVAQFSQNENSYAVWRGTFPARGETSWPSDFAYWTWREES